MTTLDRIAVHEEFRADIKRAVQILTEAGCTAVYLFGSLARGEAHPDSDIDLAVRGCPQTQFFHLQGQLLTELQHSADLVDLDTSNPFAAYLEQKGALLQIG